MLAHVSTFMNTIPCSKCWKQLFQLKGSLNLSNILHIAELCIVVPLSNTGCERVFRICGTSHETLEPLLQLSLDNVFQAENYDHAIELFLTEYPDGTVRKLTRHLDGHAYPSKRKK